MSLLWTLFFRVFFIRRLFAERENKELATKGSEGLWRSHPMNWLDSRVDQVTFKETFVAREEGGQTKITIPI